jgi:hypothetical protein
MEYIYSISSDTANAKLDNVKLIQEIELSSIVPIVDHIDTNGDEIKIIFQTDISLEEEVSLTALVNAHDGEPIPIDKSPQEVYIGSQPAFSAKTLSNGKKLFKRVHGVKQTIAASNSGKITFTVPYIQCKINTVEVIGGAVGDTCDFNIYDSSTGIVSGYPDIKLNQFGFGVCIAKDYHEENSSYDADLVIGLVLEVDYYNSSNTDKVIGINFILHEVK